MLELCFRSNVTNCQMGFWKMKANKKFYLKKKPVFCHSINIIEENKMNTRSFIQNRLAYNLT